jgi:hypothetical protein
MSMTTGSQITNLEDEGISERALNYSFIKEFLANDDEDRYWKKWACSQLGLEENISDEELTSILDKNIATAKRSNRFGI